MYSISIFYFTFYLFGEVRTHPTHPLPTGLPPWNILAVTVTALRYGGLQPSKRFVLLCPRQSSGVLCGVCLSVREHISGTTTANFRFLFVAQITVAVKNSWV